MGLYGTGVAVRTRDAEHPLADAVGFITGERGDIANTGDEIADGHSEVQFVFPDDRHGETRVVSNDDLRVVGC